MDRKIFTEILSGICDLEDSITLEELCRKLEKEKTPMSSGECDDTGEPKGTAPEGDPDAV